MAHLSTNIRLDPEWNLTKTTLFFVGDNVQWCLHQRVVIWIIGEAHRKHSLCLCYP